MTACEETYGEETRVGVNSRAIGVIYAARFAPRKD